MRMLPNHFITRICRLIKRWGISKRALTCLRLCQQLYQPHEWFIFKQCVWFISRVYGEYSDQDGGNWNPRCMLLSSHSTWFQVAKNGIHYDMPPERILVLWISWIVEEERDRVLLWACGANAYSDAPKQTIQDYVLHWDSLANTLHFYMNRVF